MPKVKSNVISFPKNPATSVPMVVNDDPEAFVTVAQVAERLHVKVATVYEWTRRREENPIPHYPISRKVILFKWSEVQGWVLARRVA